MTVGPKRQSSSAQNSSEEASGRGASLWIPTEGRIADNLELAIRNSDNIIVAITKGCFEGIKEDGNWLKEISLAMSLGKRIIPVYFDGIQEIDPKDLTESIKDFPKENAVIYVHQYAKASFDYLCSFLTRRPIHIPL